MVCLGGDGTILHASSLFQGAIPPIISFSAGSLGFLTNHSVDSLEADLKAVIYGCEDLGQCSMEDEVGGNSPADPHRDRAHCMPPLLLGGVIGRR